MDKPILHGLNRYKCQVSNVLSCVKRRSAKLLHRFAHDLGYRQEIKVFQTEVGIKYCFGRFDSSWFNKYIIEDVLFTSADISFSELLMSPDLLRDHYTLCGQPVLQSPHYRLIGDIISNTLTLDSEYVTRRRMGILDARLPAEFTLDLLIQKYQERQEMLSSEALVTILVTRVNLGGKAVHIILDGKHRAALVAYHNRPESLLMRIISNEFVKEPFFAQIYSYTLRMNPTEYSINQKMIQALHNEP